MKKFVCTVSTAAYGEDFELLATVQIKPLAMEKDY